MRECSGTEKLHFSIHKILRRTDADKIGNLTQHPKSLGTAEYRLLLDFR